MRRGRQRRLNDSIHAYCFFFQAEDGIRYYKVTGVQTCALPILLRDEIVASWERCALAGLRPERFEVPYDADFDSRGRLCWAAGPVLDRVGDDLDGTGVGLLLTDQRARVLARRVADHDTAGLLDRVQLAPGYGYREEQIGTNAIGTAIAGRGPALVVGQEHFADALTRLACAAVSCRRSRDRAGHRGSRRDLRRRQCRPVDAPAHQ